ncbi:MAG: alpha-ketoglutarate decarboxylase [Muriicola sp.]|nr:alpha-ketoglutarate decarboxylase [Muriicola sp.]NNK10007.1 alpha-ketoglutarate decarboxylase [Flavobacteriaceae bacterium]
MNSSSAKKIQILLFFFFCSSVLFGCYAQGRYPGTSFWSELRYGGSFGLGFGNNSLNIVAAPAAIYPVSEQFAIGSNLSFNYAKFGDAKFTAYGAGVLGYYNPIPALQFSSEFEQLRVNRSFGSAFPELKENYWLPVLFLGVGYTSGPVTFGLRYDVLYDENKSLYADPWMPFIRVFF